MDVPRKGDLDGAQQEYEAARRLEPRGPWAYFGLAAVHAARGETTRSLAELERAFELGFQNRTWLDTYSQFAGLRDDPRFQRLVARYRPVGR